MSSPSPFQASKSASDPEACLQSLQAHVGKLAWSIERQLDAVERLKRAALSGQSDVDKLACETTTYLFMFQALQEKIGKNLNELAPLVASPGNPDHDESTTPEKQRINALSQSAAALNSSLELNDVLYQAMQSLIDHTGAERAFLLLADEETGEMRLELSRNIEESTLSGSEFAVSNTIVNAVVSSGEPIVTTNAAADPRFSAEHSIAIHSLRSIVCVPLTSKSKVIGVIYADHRVKTGQFTTTDVAFLATFANQASSAIQNARLFESVSVAKNLMLNVFESMAGGVITTDMQGVVTMCNSAAEQILGIDAADCVNMPSTLVLPALDGVVADFVDWVLADDTKSYNKKVEGNVANRGSVSLIVSAEPLKDDRGELQGVVVLLDDQTESMRFERQRGLVKRYLPAQLVDSLSDLKDLQLGGARGKVSIFFADIRGFTGFSEQHDPKEIVEVINAYFGIASDHVHANQGIVDKYMGDAVMAHYNSPLSPLEDHAWLAVKTAWQTRAAIEEFLKENTFGSQLEFGIGVNTGDALAGNVGASARMEYTLIGDAVNVAKRLQENAKPGQILLGHGTYELVRDKVAVREALGITLKGRESNEEIYELLSLNA